MKDDLGKKTRLGLLVVQLCMVGFIFWAINDIYPANPDPATAFFIPKWLVTTLVALALLGGMVFGYKQAKKRIGKGKGNE